MGFLSWLFGIIVFVRNALFHAGVLKAHRLPGKVISVGNIAVGGTGKSPMIVAIAEHLIAKGARPAILTRGYHGGLRASQWMVLLNSEMVAGNAPTNARPDEALMQSSILTTVPVVVGAKRKKAALAWLKYLRSKGQDKEQPTHWLLDDGFQHRKIHRDFDIVLLDADKPFGKLLPKGRFREPTESLGRADAVIFTRSKPPRTPKTGDRSFVSLIAPQVELAASEMIFMEPVNVWLAADPQAATLSSGVCLVSGIGQPKSFRDAATQMGLNILSEEIFNDHQQIEFERIAKSLEKSGGPKVVLMTEKDWARSAKDAAGFKYPIFVLPMRATLPDEIAARIK